MSEHVTRNLIFRLARRTLSSDEVARTASHLVVCTQCKQSLRKTLPEVWGIIESTLSDGGPGTGSYRVSEYSRILDNASTLAAAESQRMDVARREAPKLYQELTSLSRSQQTLLIRNSPRFRSWALMELLLERVQATWTEDPRKSEGLAELVLKISERFHAKGIQEKLINDIRADSWSCIANCRRIQTDFAAARDAFSKAEYFLARGTGDPMEYARFCDLKSSFLRDVHEFERARELLDEAISEYRRVGDRPLEGRALLNLAKLLGDAGQKEGLLAILERASRLLDVQHEPWLGFIIEMKRVHYLSELGLAPEAEALLPKLRRLAKNHGNRLDRLRVLWIEGKLCKNQDKVALAEEALKQAREGFIAAEIGYDVALVSLDLAALYLESSRTEEARALATESIPLFTSRGIHREALAAWTLFRDAAERDALTVGLVQEVATRIRQAQGLPGAPD